MVRTLKFTALAAVIALAFTGTAGADPGNAGKVKIAEYGFNAPGTDTSSNRNAEFVRLFNVSGAEVDVTGWTLHDTYQNAAGDYGNRYVFKVADLPTGSPFRKDADPGEGETLRFVIPAGGTVYVYQGSGSDTTPANTTAAIYRNAKHMWNNGGDTIYLRDTDGTTVAWVRYDAYRVRIG